MANSKRYRRGDVVVHPSRPEWGQGVVREALLTTHRGKPAQRLSIEFANKGRVVINTAVAPLAPKGRAKPMSQSTATTAAARGGWLASLEQSTNDNPHELWELPEAMTDPFATSTKRLEATLESFRFSTEARRLIDWAVAQTGLNDPMTKYTRQDLEQAFHRFARDRDQHLHGLVRQIKRSGNAHLIEQAAARTAIPEARTALEQAMRNG